ncbi:MAG: VWA domain-containing protein [Bryobacteraceae bacterium]
MLRNWALASLWCASVFAQETVIRVDVNLVRILATVKDAEGRLVGTLEKEDFAITDNGVRQEISVFDRQTEQPLRIALLVDKSASTAKDLGYMLDAIRRFLRTLLAEGNAMDTVALYSFNYEVRKHNHFTRNMATLERSLKALRPVAGTSLYDALYLASGELEGKDGRKVLLVVTDGGDTTSTIDFHKALEAAHLADAVIYSVLVMPITNDAGRNIGGENALTTLGQRTGGRVFTPTLGPALNAAFSSVLKELRTQYLLGYYPRNVPATKNRFHQLEVRVRDGELRVSARNGYYGVSEPRPDGNGRNISVAPRERDADK